jgi:hypothetical protein
MSGRAYYILHQNAENEGAFDKIATRHQSLGVRGPLPISYSGTHIIMDVREFLGQLVGILSNFRSKTRCIHYTIV